MIFKTNNENSKNLFELAKLLSQNSEYLDKTDPICIYKDPRFLVHLEIFKEFIKLPELVVKIQLEKDEAFKNLLNSKLCVIPLYYFVVDFILKLYIFKSNVKIKAFEDLADKYLEAGEPVSISEEQKMQDSLALVTLTVDIICQHQLLVLSKLLTFKESKDSKSTLIECLFDVFETCFMYKEYIDVNAFSKIYTQLTEGLLTMEYETFCISIEENELVQRNIRHIGIECVDQFYLNIFSVGFNKDPKRLTKHLNNTNFIIKILAFMNLKQKDTQACEGAFTILLELIKTSKNTHKLDEFITTMYGNRFTKKVFDMLFDSAVSDACLKCLLTLLTELVRHYIYLKCVNRTVLLSSALSLSNIIKAFEEKLNCVALILKNQYYKPNLNTESLAIEEGLGIKRLKFCDFIAELVYAATQLNNEPIDIHLKTVNLIKDRDGSSDSIDKCSYFEYPLYYKLKNFRSSYDVLDLETEKEHKTTPTTKRTVYINDLILLNLYNSSILFKCLDLFFKYKWNSFLHATIFDIVYNLINSDLKQKTNVHVLSKMFGEYQLIEKIVEAQLLNLEHVRKPKGIRLGYMGHINLMSTELIDLVQRAKFLFEIEIQSKFEDDIFDNLVYYSTSANSLKKEQLAPENRTQENAIDIEHEQLARYLYMQVASSFPNLDDVL